MDFEQDYIMRLIKDMVSFLMYIVTGKTQRQYELASGEEDLSPCDDIYLRIITLADDGRINEAENLLYENLDIDNESYLLMGLTVYSHINEYTDDFLQESNYSREEIRDEIKNFAQQYGITGLETFCEQCDFL